MIENNDLEEKNKKNIIKLLKFHNIKNTSII